ncbi:hypothetical protein [Streptomyces sp. cg35]|uniref:hypothetical protein n=1 Tax=Streptomyces sp. cg35 TaxID=3421650 RepID=UPI003D16E968
MFLIELPPGFDPGAWGWKLTPGGVWLRWEIPFKWPATLAYCVPGSRVAWYGHPRHNGPANVAVEDAALLLEICCNVPADPVSVKRTAP